MWTRMPKVSQHSFLPLNDLPVSLLAHLHNPLIISTVVPDAIPEDEALRLRTKLREIGPNQFILDYLTSGRYTAKRLLTAFDVYPPAWLTDGPDENCYRLLGLALLRDISARHKLPQYNTIDDVVELLRTRNNIMVITGAGVSSLVVPSLLILSKRQSRFLSPLCPIHACLAPLTIRPRSPPTSASPTSAQRTPASTPKCAPSASPRPKTSSASKPSATTPASSTPTLPQHSRNQPSQHPPTPLSSSSTRTPSS